MCDCGMDFKFSLDSLYKHEEDVRSLLRNIGLQNIGDVNQTALDRRLRKEDVVTFAVKIVGLLKKSQDLVKCAAADLDFMKCEQLQNQSKLLEVQEEVLKNKSDQLEAVKSTVDDKLTGWAAIVEKNSAKTVTQKVMKKAVKSAMKECDREYNVVMFNVEEEQEDGDSSDQYNIDTARNVISSTGLTSFEGDFSTERIGSPDTEKNRPLLVKFDYKTAAFELLAKSKHLKDDENYSMVFIAPDRSREQRDEHRKLVQQLKQKRADNPGAQFYIRNKTIYSSD